MRRDTKKNRQPKCSTQEAVCAGPVSPIIFNPSFMRSSFSFTSWLIVFATGYMTAMITRMANVKPTCSMEQLEKRRPDGGSQRAPREKGWRSDGNIEGQAFARKHRAAPGRVLLAVPFAEGCTTTACLTLTTAFSRAPAADFQPRQLPTSV